MKTVYSTLAADQDYTTWSVGHDGNAHSTHVVRIKGGTGVIPGGKTDKDAPIGTMTEISDDDAAHLEQNHSFKFHRDRGFVTVVDGGKADPEKVVAKQGMNLNDAGQQLTEQSPQLKSADANTGEGDKPLTASTRGKS